MPSGTPPFTITAIDVEGKVAQLFQLMQVMFEDYLAGARKGDVFSIDENDILTIDLISAGGLQKVSSELGIKIKTDGGIAVGSDGLYVAAHDHDGETLQLDGINSDGGAFSFNTTGTVSFNQAINLGDNTSDPPNPSDGSMIWLSSDPLTFAQSYATYPQASLLLVADSSVDASARKQFLAQFSQQITEAGTYDISTLNAFLNKSEADVVGNLFVSNIMGTITAGTAYGLFGLEIDLNLQGGELDDSGAGGGEARGLWITGRLSPSGSVTTVDGNLTAIHIDAAQDSPASGVDWDYGVWISYSTVGIRFDTDVATAIESKNGTDLLIKGGENTILTYNNDDGASAFFIREGSGTANRFSIDTSGDATLYSGNLTLSSGNIVVSGSVDGLTDLYGHAHTGTTDGAGIEGTSILSTGEGGGSKFLREDGNNSSSWQTVPVGAHLHDGDTLECDDITSDTGEQFVISTIGEFWVTIDSDGTPLTMKLDTSGNLEMAGDYINFDGTSGDGGYGFRDNAGAMEFKDSGGGWAAFGGGGGEWTDQTTYIEADNYTDFRIYDTGYVTIGNEGTNPSTNRIQFAPDPLGTGRVFEATVLNYSAYTNLLVIETAGGHDSKRHFLAQFGIEAQNGTSATLSDVVAIFAKTYKDGSSSHNKNIFAINTMTEIDGGVTTGLWGIEVDLNLNAGAVTSVKGIDIVGDWDVTPSSDFVGLNMYRRSGSVRMTRGVSIQNAVVGIYFENDVPTDIGAVGNLVFSAGAQFMVLDSAGHLFLSTGGEYKGTGDNDAAKIKVRSAASSIQFGWKNNTDLTFKIDATVVCHIANAVSTPVLTAGDAP